MIKVQKELDCETEDFREGGVSGTRSSCDNVIKEFYLVEGAEPSHSQTEKTSEEKARDAISDCQRGNGIVTDVSNDGSVTCSWGDTEQSRKLKEEGYTDLTEENIAFIINCINENRDPVISATSMRCEG